MAACNIAHHCHVYSVSYDPSTITCVHDLLVLSFAHFCVSSENACRLFRIIEVEITTLNEKYNLVTKPSSILRLSCNDNVGGSLCGSNDYLQVRC